LEFFRECDQLQQLRLKDFAIVAILVKVLESHSNLTPAKISYHTPHAKQYEIMVGCTTNMER